MKKCISAYFSEILLFLMVFLIAETSLWAQYPAATDTTFKSRSIVDDGSSEFFSLTSTALQSDGKIIMAGEFRKYDHVSRQRIARLEKDGELDLTFNVGTGADSTIQTIALQPNGKIIIGGAFTNYNGIACNHIARLNTDGSYDNTFTIGAGANGNIASLIIQTDGKIMITGTFTSFDGIASNHIARLNQDGTYDNTFHPGPGPNAAIYCQAIQSDGKIIIGGEFTSYNGISSNYVARLNSDGTFDNSFDVGTNSINTIFSVCIQPDGKIVLGGYVTSDYTTFNGLGRLNPDGTIDATFHVGIISGVVIAITRQPDGKLLIAGNVHGYTPFPTNAIVRLLPDGTFDHSFDPGPIGGQDEGYIGSISLQPDGKIIIGGGMYTRHTVVINKFILRLQGNKPSNKIRGIIHNDLNSDCTLQPLDKRIPSMLVKAMPGPYYGITDIDGKYEIQVDTGTSSFTVSQQFNQLQTNLIINKCSASRTVALTGSYKDTASFDFADSIKQCAILHLNILKSRMRRCARGNTFINYFNYGEASSTNTQIKVVYPSYLLPISSVPMWTSRQDSLLVYDLATLPAGFRGQITIIDSVVCGNEAIRGLTQCIKATITPLSNCIPQNPGWDRASTTVYGSCKNQNASFTIYNRGTGNMNDSLAYRVFQNDTLIFTAKYKLSSNDSINISYPAGGQTIRLEADQALLHPGQSRPRATIENCGTSLSWFVPRGLVTSAPLDDLDEEVAISCNVIFDSYDPNDKQAVPSGTGLYKQITPGQEIEYIIRFQNTGTDTAYTVQIVDTLDTSLDVASFMQGASSHPYTLNVTGKGKAVLSFNFNHINLPDSTKNKAGSNGVVSFRIKVPGTTPVGTLVKNKAYIYFDYNSPVLTNETVQTVSIAVEQDLSKGSKVQVGQVTTGIQSRYHSGFIKLYPNPSTGLVTIETPDYSNSMELRISSMIGIVQKSLSLNKVNLQEINLEGLPQGMYVYEFFQNGMRTAGGILQIR